MAPSKKTTTTNKFVKRLHDPKGKHVVNHGTLFALTLFCLLLDDVLKRNMILTQLARNQDDSLGKHQRMGRGWDFFFFYDPCLQFRKFCMSA
jgi:hypothetical protein